MAAVREPHLWKSFSHVPIHASGSRSVLITFLVKGNARNTGLLM